VHAADAPAARVVEALHADRQPGDTGRAEGAEALALEGAGVGLQRDLAAGLQRQAGADVGQQPVDASGENRLGVPPPMNTLTTRRPQTSGSAASRSARSASR
jgi:hypothetical protein